MWFVLVVIACMIFYFIHAFFSALSRDRLGVKYKYELNLNRIEIRQLNRLASLLKREFYLAFCIENTIKLYLSVFRELSSYKQRNPVLNKNLMRYCICMIRYKYDFKPYPADQMLAFKATISPEDIKLIEDKSELIAPLSDDEESRIYTNDNQRWKRKYDEIIQTFDVNNPSDFYEEMVRLASLNRDVRLMDMRNIFYKSYLFMVGHHKETSLKLYLHYLNVKSVSGTFKYKQISVRNASKLFKEPEHKTRFDTICSQLQATGDLEKALTEVDSLYVPIRRKISLNVESIQEANAKQTKVAKILGAYLDDEPVAENMMNVDIVDVTNTTEINQKELFDLFISKAFRLNQQEVNIFAQSKGLFCGQFIESINEQYYEALDDLLIEEDGDDYILNETYFQQIAG